MKCVDRFNNLFVSCFLTAGSSHPPPIMGAVHAFFLFPPLGVTAFMLMQC